MVPGDKGGRARVGLEGTGGRNYKVAGGIFWGRFTHYLDCGNGFMGEYICPNISNAHFKYVQFIYSVPNIPLNKTFKKYTPFNFLP